MKWLFGLIVIVALGVGGYFATAYLSGGALPTLGLVMGGERGEVRNVVMKFWEDLKFDDAKSATALMVPSANDPSLVGVFLSNVFSMPPESLDIVSYNVDAVEIDSTGHRARVKSSIVANDLRKKTPIQTEAMLFLRKVEEAWLLDLSSSF
ncbi:MAG: hypothetical protein O2897_01405 [bacterium]|nr:hypothetical protein [bacterium]